MTADWEEHEDHIADLYRLLGYEVQQNISVAGQQTDLICRKHIPGAGDTVLYVDAKHTTRGNRSHISNQDVDDFASTFHARKDTMKWTVGILVANKPFSAQAQAAAAIHYDIVLKTLEDLYEDVLALRPYLRHHIHQYEESAVFSDYIALTARSVNEYAHPTGQALSLLGFVDSWLEGAKSQLCILGDFGSGKTTFLQYLHYTLGKQYLDGSSHRIPLYLPLRGYYDTLDTADLISRFCARELSTRTPQSLFEAFLRQGRFLMLLDGFDEMGTSSDADSRKQNYLKLAPLASENSKLIVSCRPSYFVTSHELMAVFSAYDAQVGYQPPAIRGDPTHTRPFSQLSVQLQGQIAGVSTSALKRAATVALSGTDYQHLQLFDRRQILSYLRKHESNIMRQSKGQLDAESLLQRIDDVYDLEDLARRPMLLKMIVATLPTFRQMPDGSFEVTFGRDPIHVEKITPSLLYHVYTEQELIREYQKGEVRWMIDRQTKKEFIAKLAFDMMKQNRVTYERDEVVAIVNDIFHPSSAQTDAIITDLRTCSFLVRESRDSIRFTHKSFMEYFASQILYERIRTRGLARESLSERLYPDEVMYFAGDWVATFSPTTVQTLRNVYDSIQQNDPKAKILRGNLIAILQYARSPVLQLTDIEVERIYYLRHALDEMEVASSKIGECTLQRITLAKLHISKSEIKRLTLSATTVQSVRVEGTDIAEFLASNSESRVGIVDSALGRLELDGTCLKGSHIQHTSLHFTRCSRVDWSRSSFIDVVLSGEDSLTSIGEVTGVVFKDCIFLYMNCEELVAADVQFVNCVFLQCAKSSQSGLEKLKGSVGVFVAPPDVEVRSQIVKGRPLLVTRKQAEKPLKYEYKLEDWERYMVKWLRAFPLARVRGGRYTGDDVRSRVRSAIEAGGLWDSVKA
jgi:hypothetical protein